MTTAASSAGDRRESRALSARGTPRKPSGGFELWSWFFMRLSGLALLGLALGHLVIMHLINNVDFIDYDFVAARYAGWFWRGYDLLLLVLAMVHGTNGVRILIDDYVHPLPRRRIAIVLMYAMCGVFLALGIYTIVMFKPVTGHG